MSLEVFTEKDINFGIGKRLLATWTSVMGVDDEFKHI